MHNFMDIYLVDDDSFSGAIHTNIKHVYFDDEKS